MFLNLFGTVFHIRLPLKQRACVPYLEWFQVISRIAYFGDHIKYFSSQKNLS